MIPLILIFFFYLSILFLLLLFIIIIRGKLRPSDFELLLMSVGYQVTPKELDNCLKDLGARDGECVTFDMFFDWWTSDVGACMLQRRLK